jgi:intein/homing endonuclease
MKTKKIQIKNLTIGDKIKTLDKDKTVCFKTVLDKWDTIVKVEDQVKLEFENGSILECSINHPIMIICNDTIIQKLPLELNFNDIVISDKSLTKLKSIHTNLNNPINYVDITVDDEHTFFAAHDQNSEMILTHNSQGGVRKGSATLYFPVWHLEIEDLVVLKNNKGSEENRCISGDSKIEIEYNGSSATILIENLQYYLDNYKNVKVLSFNEKTLQKEFKEVLGFQKTKSNATVIKIEYSGKELVCTPDHKIFTHNRGYVEAQNLLENDVLEIN